MWLPPCSNRFQMKQTMYSAHKNTTVRQWIMRLPTFCGFWRFLVPKELANAHSFILLKEGSIIEGFCSRNFTSQVCTPITCLGSIMPATGAYVQSLRIALTAGTTNWWKFVPGGAHRWSALNVHLPNNHVCGHDNKVHIIFESDTGQKEKLCIVVNDLEALQTCDFKAKICTAVNDLKTLQTCDFEQKCVLNSMI